MPAISTGVKGNAPSVSACGSEVLTVGPANSSYSVSVSESSSGVITITLIPAYSAEATIVVTIATASIAKDHAVAAKSKKCKKGQVKIKGKCLPATTLGGKASGKGSAGVPLKLKVTLSSKIRALLAKGKTEHVTADADLQVALRRDPDGQGLPPGRQRQKTETPLDHPGDRGRRLNAGALGLPRSGSAGCLDNADMEGSMAETGARSWLRCYRCWSNDLEVQVHYEGIHKIDSVTGERAESSTRSRRPSSNASTACTTSPPGFINGRVEPIEDRWERMIAGTPWVASCTVTVDADDVEPVRGPSRRRALLRRLRRQRHREFFTHVRFHKHDDDGGSRSTCWSSCTRARSTRRPRCSSPPRAGR